MHYYSDYKYFLFVLPFLLNTGVQIVISDITFKAYK